MTGRDDEFDDEFDVVARWTGEAAVELGADHYLPAACRGSGDPGVLSWLLDALDLVPGASLLDCGAGVGGPAAYAAHHRAVRPVLTEPQPGACLAAARLFGLPVVRAVAQRLPFHARAFDAAWCLGVLCTTRDQAAVLAELTRVVAGPRVGLLVYVRCTDRIEGAPSGNHFPDEAELVHLAGAMGMRVAERVLAADVSERPEGWAARAADVEEALAAAHGRDSAWLRAEQRSTAFARLLDDGLVHGLALVLQRSGPSAVDVAPKS